LCPALHHQYINEFVKTQKKSPSGGVYEMLVRAQHPSIEGSVLGYEPLCYYDDLDHTWYCNDLHVHAFERWRIKPNEHGFLDSFEDAKKIAEMALSIGAEDGWWLPWLIIKYAPKA
jgi:hypothetical protein